MLSEARRRIPQPASFVALLLLLGCGRTDDPRASRIAQEELAYRRGREFVTRIESARAFRVYDPVLAQVPRREGFPDLGKLGDCEILEEGPVLNSDQLMTLELLLRFALPPSRQATCCPTPAFGFLVIGQGDSAHVIVSEECRTWWMQMNSGRQDGSLYGYEDRKSDQLLTLMEELFPPR